MTEYYILLVTAFLILVITISKKNTVSIIITVGLFLALLTGLFSFNHRTALVGAIFLLSAFGGGVNGFFIRENDVLLKLAIIVPCLVNVFHNLSLLLSYDFQFTKILILISFTVFIIGIFRGAFKRPEIGYVFVLIMDFILRIVDL